MCTHGYPLGWQSRKGERSKTSANVVVTIDHLSDKTTHNTPMIGVGITLEQTQQFFSHLHTQGAAPTSQTNFFDNVYSSYKKSREWIVDTEA